MLVLGRPRNLSTFWISSINTLQLFFYSKSGPGSKYPKHENKTCYGVNLENHSFLSKINLDWLIHIIKQGIKKFFLSSLTNLLYWKIKKANHLRKNK